MTSHGECHVTGNVDSVNRLTRMPCSAPLPRSPVLFNGTQTTDFKTKLMVAFYTVINHNNNNSIH